DGRYVPLDAQDVSRWRRSEMDEAERLLHIASKKNQIGRYQLEAAIQSAHAARAYAGRPDWPAIALLYEALANLTGSPVAHLNEAAAISRRDDAQAGLSALAHVVERFPGLEDYQPYWALRADLCAKIGRRQEA